MRMVTKHDILEALGMETEDRFMTGMLIGIGVGALIGGLTSLLLAPARGADLREQIGGKVKGVVSKVRGRSANSGMESEFIPTGTTTEPTGY
jgi:hypothetical protein